MFTVYNNLENKVVFVGNDYEFITFMKKIVTENGDTDYSIIGVSDATEYLDDYCSDLELVEDRNTEPVFFQTELTKVKGNVLDLVYPHLKGSEQLTIEERLGTSEGKCEECGSNTWYLIPKFTPLVRQSGKQYIECMNCGNITHL